MNESGVSAICIFDGQRRSKAKAEEVMFFEFCHSPTFFSRLKEPCDNVFVRLGEGKNHNAFKFRGDM